MLNIFKQFAYSYNQSSEVEELKKQVAELKKENAELKKENEELKKQVEIQSTEIQRLKELLKLSNSRKFGTSSEKTKPDQETTFPLFNEVEAIADPDVQDPTLEEVKSYYRKKKRTRGETLNDLPKETIEYRLPEEDQCCPECNGQLHEIGKKTRSHLKIIPAKKVWLEIIRFVYGCRNCERTGSSTPMLTAQPSSRAP